MMSGHAIPARVPFTLPLDAAGLETEYRKALQPLWLQGFHHRWDAWTRTKNG